MSKYIMNDNEIKEFQKKFIDDFEYDELMDLFKMFAHSTRLKIFNVLSEKECSVKELSLILDMSQSAISHQLSNLRKHNLVKFEKVGLNAFYSLADSHVMTIFTQALDHVREEDCTE